MVRVPICQRERQGPFRHSLVREHRIARDPEVKRSSACCLLTGSVWRRAYSVTSPCLETQDETAWLQLGGKNDHPIRSLAWRESWVFRSTQ